MEEKQTQSLQHIQVPNDLILTKDITPVDVLVYLALKSFDGKDGCFPSLTSIAERSQLSRNAVIKSIKNLKDSNWIKSNCEGKGHYTYYTFLKNLPFEPFSYEFLESKELTPMTKAYLICSQQDMFKNSETEGILEKSAMNISQDINMPIRTVYQCEQELKDKGILSIDKTKRYTDIAGCKKDLRVYDFSKYFQVIAYILRNHENRISDVEIQLRENNKQYRSLEERTHKELMILAAAYNSLKQELKELKRNKGE